MERSDSSPPRDGAAAFRTMTTPKKPDKVVGNSNSGVPPPTTATTTMSGSSSSTGGWHNGDTGNNDGDNDGDNKQSYRVVLLPQRLSNELRTTDATDHTDGFCSNVVTTSKYTAWNFVPRFLLESFRKLANAYFLLVSALQTIKPISNTHGLPSTLPALTFILAVDAVLAIVEDRRRHRADDEANATTCHVVTATFTGDRAALQPTDDPAVSRLTWADLTVGSIVKLHNRETAPADLLLLSVHEATPNDPSGICYVETKSLDGETNLKLRHACDATLNAQTAAQIAGLCGYVRCETPNRAISRFDGIVTLRTIGSDSVVQQPVAIKNVILRGCQLRNTAFVYGLVVNTGPDTKIMQSSVATRPKWSAINEAVNRMIVYLFAFLLLLCVAAATVHVLWMERHAADVVYLGVHRDATLQWFVTVGQYLLLMYQMIPVSLYVTMSMVLMLQALFMSWDLELYYAPLDSRVLVRSMGLNEELGQISYVFSDKTGTLTCNVMEFRKCSIHGVAYGTGITEIGKATLRRRGIAVPDDSDDEGDNGASRTRTHKKRAHKVPYVNFEDDRLVQALNQQSTASVSPEAEFFLHLSLCHTVIPEVVTGDDGRDAVRFSASSPDEQALVSAAKFFGCSFESRGLGVARVRVQHASLLTDSSVGTELQEFRILDVLEFTSERKRMSVVVRTPRNELWLLTKGADSALFPLLSSTANAPELLAATMQHLEAFADDALRTLTVAHKRLDERMYETWSAQFAAACASLDEIEKRKRDAPNRIDALMNELETDLVLLGATAIEDKLQDHVPRAIARLMAAGMKVWMLTGDKQETAINIAFACSLLDNDMVQLVLNCERFPTADDVKRALEDAMMARTAAPKRQHAVVIDGECLELVLADTASRDAFLAFAMHCAGVVCCRVSPSQKAEIVTLVRAVAPDARTLAVGDGANDVAMIQRAHVGVGISGMEGMQAVNASDYAVAQFYFLEKLLLHHGRLNYRRMSALVGYMFYKNIFLALAQYVYMVAAGGASGQKFYSEVAFQLYNLAYTALPIGVLGVFDYDVPWTTSRHFPQLYLVGPRKELFNRYTFAKWLVSALFESTVVAAVVLLGFSTTRSSAGAAPLLQYGVLAFTCVVLVANLKVVLWQMSWTTLAVASWLLGVLAYMPATLLLTSSLPGLSATDYGAFENTLSQPAFWFAVPLCVVLCLLRHFAWSAIQRRFRPQPWQVVQEAYVLDKQRSRHHQNQQHQHQCSGANTGGHATRFGKLEDGRSGHDKLLEDEPDAATFAQTMALSPTGSSPARLSEGRGSQRRSSSSSGFAFSYDEQTAIDEALVMRRSARSLSSAVSDADGSPRGKSFSGLLV